MKIRTLIVDDEPPARAKLRRKLLAESDLEVVGEAGNGEDAIRAIGELQPQLLFLDVEMPPPNGLEVLRAVRDEWLPCTIFTTAHAQHAVEAFELHAVDYLLKPFNEERLATALSRARSRVRENARQSDTHVAALLQKAAPTLGPAERFLVKNNERYIVISATDIVWVEAAANYVILHTPTGNQVLRRTLAQLEGELDPRRFFRTSRSTVVNLNCVREVQALGPGEHVVFLSDGKQVPLTRGLREFQDRLQNPGAG